jgi:hypothetical protein
MGEFIGNSTVNSSLTTTQLRVGANSTFTMLTANATGVYANATLVANSIGPYGKTEGNLNVNSATYATSAGSATNASAATNATYATNAGTANNSTYLNGQLASFYTNATNITTGTLPYAQIPANVINTTAAFTISGVHTHNANVIMGSSGLSANGGFGTAGHVLHSNGTATYWATDDAGVTSVATGNGLTGGTITATGTVSVLANNGITANATGLYVTQGTGTVVNATGVHVNSTYIGTLSANNTTYVNGKTEGNLNVNSATYATSAGSATNASAATNATYATSAGSATNATYATSAGSATTSTTQALTDNSTNIVTTNWFNEAIYSTRGAHNISGGGTISYGAVAGFVKWTARFIIIGDSKGTSSPGNANYYDINCPSTGSIDVVGTTAVTATTNGIPLASWQALYYDLGDGSAAGATAFHIVDYNVGTANYMVPADWVLLAVVNGDNSSCKFTAGVVLDSGESFDTTAYSSYKVPVAASATNATSAGSATNATYATSAGTANTTQSLTFASDGTGAAATSTFNGGTARTISYNSVGAPSTTGTNASGTWSININGSAASATNASAATNATNASNLGGVAAANYARTDTADTFDGAVTFSAGANSIIFSNATSNFIGWNTSGVAAPAVTTRSAGTKLLLYPAIAATSVDYAAGIENNHLWLSTATTAGGIKLYANTSTILLSNTTGTYINGTQAVINSGTWSININGSAASATNASAATNATYATTAGSAPNPNAVTFNNGGAGAASGSTYTGAATLTVSYNTVGAPSTTGTNASGTWSININGSAASATNASAATNATYATSAGTSGVNNADNYVNVRVIRNSNLATNNDGMFIGYGSTNSGATRIYGAGSTVGHSYIDASGNWFRSDAVQYVLNTGTWSINVNGSAGSTTQAVTFNNGGAGAASGTTFNGGTARTISYNSIGAPSTTGTNASGTWSININGSAASATNASAATNATYATNSGYPGVGLDYQSVTNAAALQSTGWASYPHYKVYFWNTLPVTQSQSLYMRIYIAGAFGTSNYYHESLAAYNNGNGAYYGGTYTFCYLTYPGYFITAATGGSGMAGTIELLGANVASVYKSFRWDVYGAAYTTGFGHRAFGGGWYTGSTGAITGIQLYSSSGNITGNMRVVGYN